MKQLLIIEDDEHLSRGLVFTFAQEGYQVSSADCLAEARHHLAAQAIDLIVLDLGLPDGNGMDFCQEVRATSSIPILMLTARDLETDEVSGLLAGADDYLTKPFSLSVLRARVAALLRRTAATPSSLLQSGSIRLDTRQCRLFREDTEIPVSATEYRLLSYLLSHSGQTVSKEQILSALWDHDGQFVDENTVSVNISRLRAKLESDPRSPRLIKTVHGLGYMWSGER